MQYQTPRKLGASPKTAKNSVSEPDTVNEGLNALKQQQSASGYGLRSDMVASQQRMTLFLNKANNALQHGDTANAQKYFDQADAEISKLEKFLGH